MLASNAQPLVSAPALSTGTGFLPPFRKHRRSHWVPGKALIVTAAWAILPSAFSAEPNRAIPKVEPPGTSLQFSATVTRDELGRARVFEEPLIPIGGEPMPEENKALARALSQYSRRAGPDDFSGLTEFLSAYPESRWAASLLTCLGIEYFNTGHYSKAIDAWERAWALSKEAVAPNAKAVANRAVGELAYMYARVGRAKELKALLDSVEGREFTGSATEKIAGTRRGLWIMQETPERAFRCGPLALDRILAVERPKDVASLPIHDAPSTTNGFSLARVAQLSRELGMNFQMAFRRPGAALVIPAVVHWKVGHYAAMIRRENDRLLLQDPTFGNDVWVTETALNEETTGYFLIPPGLLPEGWRAVSEREGNDIWGKGPTTDSFPGATSTDDSTAHGGGGSDGSGGNGPGRRDCGMAVYDIHLMLVSLNITDTPVGYDPPFGPPVYFRVSYNQREAYQPAVFYYSNLGQKWTFDWLAFILDNPQNASADVTYYVEGGGAHLFTGYNSANQSYATELRQQTRLVRTSPDSYEMQYPDGSKKVFSQSDGALGTARRVFLTRIYDPYGNFVTLTYDSNLRLVAITDAIGQVTSLAYENAADILKITKVTDPFGRFAAFSYNASGVLTNITDVLGLNSGFRYGANSFVTNMITPYGTTAFKMGEAGRTRWLEATDPQGETERVEYSEDPSVGTPFSEPYTGLPQGMFTGNWYIHARNTYYWNKRAHAEAPNDHSKARIFHWLHSQGYSQASGILESEKMPFESRIWYNYEGQAPSYLGAITVGATDKPSKVGRVLEDGTTQLYQYQYNAFGNLTNAVDPAGRTFSYLYAPNGIDLTEIRQTRATNNEVIARITYNSQHLPVTFVDASGQTSSYTYTSRGQLRTVTNPKGETQTFSYDANGYLIAYDDALPGTNDITRLTYDNLGRIGTVTDRDGYTLMLEYDALDRPTKVTYPDGTDEQIAYDRLDVSSHRDRLGRQKNYFFNSLRQLVAIRDALNRVTRFAWCGCGDLSSVTDPLGRTTGWQYDVQGRVAGKTYADGSRIEYSYDATGRLQSMRDERGQLTTYDYFTDDTVKSVSYPTALIPTPSVYLTYDPNYRRLTSLQDGIGLTTYTYYPVTSTPGSLGLASVDGPLANDTIVFQYDSLGRITNRSINAVGAGIDFDEIGRVISVQNALGAFSFNYDGASRRVLTVSFPNRQTISTSYFGNTRDRLLQQLTHRKGDSSLLSQFSYVFDAENMITNWTQQAQTSPARIFGLAYDAENQLTNAIVTQSATNAATFAYAYDAAGNRIREETNGVSRRFDHNALNELISASAGANTNVSYEWDGAHRLVAIAKGDQRSEFSYDGLGRRIRLVEKLSGTNVSDRRFVWCGAELCEERDPSGAIVTKRYFSQGGQQISAPSTTNNFFYTRDHLGSIREVTDASGAVRAEYEYDP